MTDWYCLSSFDVAESVKLLRDAKFTAYCPMEQVTRRRGRKCADVSRPVWPGYGFVCCEPDELAAVRAAGAVHDFVRYTDDTGSRQPVTLTRNALVPIILAELFGALDFTDKTPAQYRATKGDRVRVSSGKWRGYLGRIVTVSKTKAKLDTDKGGKLTVDISELEAA